MADVSVPHLRVSELLDNPDVFIGAEITLEDMMIAQGCDQLNQDLCWMMSEEWLDASPDPARAVVDHSKAIRLCLAGLSHAFITAASQCGGWSIDAYSVATVRGTLIRGTDDFPLDLIRLRFVRVNHRDILVDVATS
jgi:hypothetical protein